MGAHLFAIKAYEFRERKTFNMLPLQSLMCLNFLFLPPMMMMMESNEIKLKIEKAENNENKYLLTFEHIYIATRQQRRQRRWRQILRLRQTLYMLIECHSHRYC